MFLEGEQVQFSVFGYELILVVSLSSQSCTSSIGLKSTASLVSVVLNFPSSPHSSCTIFGVLSCYLTEQFSSNPEGVACL